MRHSPAAGGLAQVEVVGAILVMSDGVMVLGCFRGVAAVVAATARSVVRSGWSIVGNWFGVCRCLLDLVSSCLFCASLYSSICGPWILRAVGGLNVCFNERLVATIEQRNESREQSDGCTIKERRENSR